jgi:hypothetical protein
MSRFKIRDPFHIPVMLAYNKGVLGVIILVGRKSDLTILTRYYYYYAPNTYNKEQACLVTKLWFCIWEALGSNLRRNADFPK